MRAGAAFLGLCLGLGGLSVSAQTLPAPTAPAPTPLAPTAAQRSATLLVVLDLDRLLRETEAGKALAARQEAESRDIMAENQQLESQLEAEERDLADRRASLSPAEFRKLADDFDQRVVAIRKARDQKGEETSRRFDAQRQAFFQDIQPILLALMQDIGAVAVIDRRAVILGQEGIDVTDQAIGRIDQALPRP